MANIKTPGEEAGKKAVKESAKSTAEHAANNPPGFAEMFTGDPVILAVGGFLALALVIIGAIVYALYVRSEDEEEFESESLDKIVKPEFKSIVRQDGNKNLSTIRRDLRKDGEVFKDVRFTENDNLVDHMKKLKSQSDNDFNPDLDVSSPDDEKVEKWVKAGVYTEEQARNIKDNGVVPHRLMWVRPDGMLRKFFWAFTDGILGQDFFSEYRLIPEHKIVDNPGDNSISIDRDIQLRPFAGIKLPLYIESFGILHAVITRQLYEASLQDQVNYSEKINFFDSKFSQQIQKLEAEAQIEDNKNSRGVAGDVNQS